MFTCEINDFCNKVLDYWFPKTERYHDIKQTDFRKWRGKIDVLSGGPPCQAVSLAGKRKGDKDDRFLWDEFIRAVREIQPTWIVAENVYGILSMVESGETPYVEGEATLPMEGYGETERVGQRYVLWKILDEIEKEGYETLPVVIPACAVGAPHERKRVWIICHRIDTDPDLDGQGERKGQQVPIPECHGKTYFGFGGEEGITTHTNSAGLQEEGTTKQATGITGDGERQSTAYTDHAGRMEQHAPSQPERVGFSLRLCDEELPADRWRDFPTQSPVCGRDDELSGRLDGITFPKWRAESIKAYGNAWVPVVAYEIFRAIEEYEKDQDNL